jgi:hypothetical protein
MNNNPLWPTITLFLLQDRFPDYRFFIVAWIITLWCVTVYRFIKQEKNDPHPLVSHYLESKK